MFLIIDKLKTKQIEIRKTKQIEIRKTKKKEIISVEALSSLISFDHDISIKLTIQQILQYLKIISLPLLDHYHV